MSTAHRKCSIAVREHLGDYQLMCHAPVALDVTAASLETDPPPSGQLNAGVRRRGGLARRPYRAWTRAEILAQVSIRLVVN